MMDTLNNGKTITESFTHDTAGAIAVFEYYAGAAFHLHGDVCDFAGTSFMTRNRESDNHHQDHGRINLAHRRSADRTTSGRRRTPPHAGKGEC